MFIRTRRDPDHAAGPCIRTGRTQPAARASRIAHRASRIAVRPRIYAGRADTTGINCIATLDVADFSAHRIDARKRFELELLR